MPGTTAVDPGALSGDEPIPDVGSPLESPRTGAGPNGAGDVGVLATVRTMDGFEGLRLHVGAPDALDVGWAVEANEPSPLGWQPPAFALLRGRLELL